jgi:hypothetical protein
VSRPQPRKARTVRSYDIAVDSEGESVITVVFSGATVQVTADHPCFAKIAAALLAGLDPTEHLSDCDPKDPRLTRRADGAVEWRGAPVHPRVQEAIDRHRLEGRDPAGLVRFLERLERNPSESARQGLYQWLEQQKLAIDGEGHFLAYKGVRADRTSVTAGPGVVDGIVFRSAHLPNHDGAVVEMPRDRVTEDPDVACSSGLHVGSYSYARGFGQTLLRVRVDPADVVSVPRDCSSQKIRCCRYEVVDLHEAPDDDLSDLEAQAGPSPEEIEEALGEAIPERFLKRLLRKARGR